MKKIIGLEHQMGFLLACLFGGLGYSHRDQPLASILCLLIAGAFLTLTVFKPRAFKPVIRIWMKGAEYLEMITTPLILTIIFWALIVPMGILRRLSGADPLGVKIDKAANSYWQTLPNASIDFEVMY